MRSGASIPGYDLSMDERGWGWLESEIRQIQLLEWIVPQSANTYVPIKPFYDGLRDGGDLTFHVMRDDLKDLERRSLIDLAAGLGGIESYDALATPDARRLVEDLQARRGDKRLLRSACRDAMVAWLYSQDAVGELTQPVRDQMLDDPRYGMWLAKPFTAEALDSAAAWLDRHGLAKGIMVDQCEGPVRLYLTDSGVACAERLDSDTSRYTEAEQPVVGAQQTLHFDSTVGSTEPTYIDGRVVGLLEAKANGSRFDCSKLIKLIGELNHNFNNGNVYSAHALLRAVLDHVPPILGCVDFQAVANNYSWSRTDKSYMRRLREFRDQADDALHRQISVKPDMLSMDDMPSRTAVRCLLQECIDKL
jgi:hypothetical protein